MPGAACRVILAASFPLVEAAAVIVFVIPVTALALSLVWVRWARRPDKPMDPLSQVEAYHRAVRALSSADHRSSRRRLAAHLGARR